MARIVRGQVISLKQKEFIEAAYSMGISNWKIITRHLIPNSLGPVIVYLTLTIPSVILEEAFLSYLGLGVQPPMSSWGTLIADGVQVMEIAPWALFFPAAFLSATLFSLNFLGDGLRDALDPKGSKD
jgi:oligopeptide transport system permease protein